MLRPVPSGPTRADVIDITSIIEARRRIAQQADICRCAVMTIMAHHPISAIEAAIACAERQLRQGADVDTALRHALADIDTGRPA